MKKKLFAMAAVAMMTAVSAQASSSTSNFIPSNTRK